jgi:hypothetical protein
MNISHQHVSSRNAYVLKDTVAVVFSDESKLWTNITYLNAR